MKRLRRSEHLRVQATAVVELLTDAGWSDIAIELDAARIERVVGARS